MSIAETVQSLRAAWRLAMLDPSGMNGFNLTVEGFWRSFSVYLFLFPAYLLMVLAPPMTQATLRIPLDSVPIETLILGKSFSFALRVVVSTVLLALLCRLLNVGERFVALIVANNWAAAIQIAVWLPIALLAARGLLPGRAGATLQTVVVIVMLFYAWFVTRTALGIGGLAALGVIVADELSSEMIGMLLDRLFGFS